MRRPIVAGNWKMHGSRTENARLIEELLAHCRAHVVAHLAEAVVEGSVPDTRRELAFEEPDVVVVAEQHGCSLPLCGGEPSTARELTLDDAERVRRDARVELHTSGGCGHHVVLEVLAHRLDELGGRGSVLGHDLTNLHRRYRAGPTRSRRPGDPTSRARPSAGDRSDA